MYPCCFRPQPSPSGITPQSDLDQSAINLGLTPLYIEAGRAAQIRNREIVNGSVLYHRWK